MTRPSGLKRSTAVGPWQADGGWQEQMDKQTSAQATSSLVNEALVPDAPISNLRLFRPDSPVVALGLAVNHLMTKPAFARQSFGDWSRILVGQINRGHYYFVTDGKHVQGFVGWALTTREKAEDWVEGRHGLSYEDCTQGDCLVFNAWAANGLRVHRFMVDEARKIIRDKQTVYFKRYYNNGTSRPVRLNVNDFVGIHVDRKVAREANR
jgi:hemolysin-activating ACP:hemolysin acyltransferase